MRDECKLGLQIAGNGGVQAADEIFKVSICRTHFLAGMLERRFRRAEKSLRVWSPRVYMSCKMRILALSPLDVGVIQTTSCLVHAFACVVIPGGWARSRHYFG